MHDFQPTRWTKEDCSNATYVQEKAIDIKGLEVLQSMAYLMPESRISYFVRVDYAGEGTYIARISRYLKVVHQDGVGVLGVIFADLFKAEQLDGYHGSLWQVKPHRGQL